MAEHTEASVVLVAAPHRQPPLRETLARADDIQLVAVHVDARDIGDARSRVVVLDHDFERDVTLIPTLGRTARRCRTVVTAPSLLRADVWLTRGCAARGYVTDVVDLPAAVRTVARGGQHWPPGLGTAPAWYGLPMVERICGYLRERERSRYARLIHDHVLPILEGLVLAPTAPSPELRTVLLEEAAMLRSVISDDPGGRLYDQLSAVVARYRMPDLGLDLRIHNPAEPVLSPAVVQALVEAVHEALRNTVRHSAARSARVSVNSDARSVTIRVVDSGTGFDPDRTPAGFGLVESVHGRMAAVGGTARILSKAGLGTVVELTAPLAG